MDDRTNPGEKPKNPRRRKRSKLQVFKETYLPLVIAGVACLLILIFIIGSITRAVQRSNAREQAQLQASIAAAEEQKRLNSEAASISDKATKLAASFDYDGAITAIEGFSDEISKFPQLERLYQQYVSAREELVSWDDPSLIPNLSVQQLIADPERAFSNKEYGDSFLKNFITVEEFTQILQQLYENGYILVDMSHITDGRQVKSLALPAGKKPLMLTQTQVNYYTYMVDGDGDKLPDKDGAGFASKLILDANGNLTCEYVTAEGVTETGAYDLVPILESFIATHPDFSYQGARATLAITGYDGIFGYRINASAKGRLGEDAYEKEIKEATQVLQALRNSGYTIACCTYDNTAYGSASSTKIESDLDRWEKEIAPVVGVVNTLVYARNSDIANATTAYEGTKFQILQNFGFTYYLGFATNGSSWFVSGVDHVRQGRLLVTGSNLTSRANWFTDLFDAAEVLDQSREDYTS